MLFDSSFVKYEHVVRNEAVLWQTFETEQSINEIRRKRELNEIFFLFSFFFEV